MRKNKKDDSKITLKIKSLLARKGLTFADYGRVINAIPQTMNKKRITDSYRVSDLVLLAKATETKLCFIDQDGNTLLEFSEKDIKK
ncbi:hypothetical protein [Thomasclavelia cocleata]|uniref:hypothetical protein n=1 Tax=Thomasclavelia cocleata TaxID=69824 RepID=UPI0024300A30|nr:hypothetical protein [Thomasclavelia cocleata]